MNLEIKVLRLRGFKGFESFFSSKVSKVNVSKVPRFKAKQILGSKTEEGTRIKKSKKFLNSI